MAIKIQKLHILAIVSVLFSIVTSFQYKIKNNHYNSFRHSKIYPSHNIHSQFGRFTYRKLTNNDINDILDEDHTDKTPIKSSRALSLIETRSNNRQYSDSYIDPSKYQLPESVVLEIRGHLNRLVELSRSIQSNPDDGNDIDDIVEKMSQIITAQCALRYITSNPTFDYVIKSSTGFTDSENVELDDTLDDSIHTPVNGNEVVFSCPISSNNICWGTLTLTCIDPMSCDMTIIANQKDPHTSTTNNYNKEIIQSLCDYCAANIASVLTTEMKRTQSQHIQNHIAVINREIENGVFTTRTLVQLLSVRLDEEDEIGKESVQNILDQLAGIRESADQLKENMISWYTVTTSSTEKQ